MICLRHGAQDALAAIEIDREARRNQREADAALVEAAGCSCTGETLFRLIADAPASPPATSCPKTLAKWLREQQGHGKTCPIFLAAQIRGQA
jgi:hypothetical protein